MRYGDFVKEMAEKWDTTQADAKRKLDAMWDFLKDAVLKGERLVLKEFGTFHMKDVKPRNVRNPQTGESFMTSAHKRVAFKSKKF